MCCAGCACILLPPTSTFKGAPPLVWLRSARDSRTHAPDEPPAAQMQHALRHMQYSFASVSAHAATFVAVLARPRNTGRNYGARRSLLSRAERGRCCCCCDRVAHCRPLRRHFQRPAAAAQPAAAQPADFVASSAQPTAEPTASEPAPPSLPPQSPPPPSPPTSLTPPWPPPPSPPPPSPLPPSSLPSPPPPRPAPQLPSPESRRVITTLARLDRRRRRCCCPVRHRDAHLQRGSGLAGARRLRRCTQHFVRGGRPSPPSLGRRATSAAAKPDAAQLTCSEAAAWLGPVASAVVPNLLCGAAARRLPDLVAAATSAAAQPENHRVGAPCGAAGEARQTD